MRFHVVALPHTKVIKEFFSCAYTEKVYGFCNMMTSLGHEVYLYASGDRTDANVTDFIPCLPEELIGIKISLINALEQLDFLIYNMSECDCEDGCCK